MSNCIWIRLWSRNPSSILERHLFKRTLSNQRSIKYLKPWWMELTSNKDNRNSERNHQYKISIYLSLPQGDNPNLEISIDYL